MSSTASGRVPSGTRVVMVTRNSRAGGRGLALSPTLDSFGRLRPGRARGAPWSGPGCRGRAGRSRSAARPASCCYQSSRPGRGGRSSQLVADGRGVDEGPDVGDAAVAEAVEDVLGELDGAAGREDAGELADRGAVEPEAGGDGFVA